MIAKYYESLIYIQLNDFKNKNKLIDYCNEFGFSIDFENCQENNSEYFCFAYGKDNLYEIIKQRSLFVLKNIIKDSKEFKILSYKIQGIVIDSVINDNFNMILKDNDDKSTIVK